MVEGGLIEVEWREVAGVRVTGAGVRIVVVNVAGREVIVALRGLVEAVGVVGNLCGLQKGMIGDVVVLGRQDGHLLLLFEPRVVLAQRVVGLLLLEVLGEARVGEVSGGRVAVQTLEGVGGK